MQRALAMLPLTRYMNRPRDRRVRARHPTCSGARGAVVAPAGCRDDMCNGVGTAGLPGTTRGEPLGAGVV
eukprot:scaffold1388_cov390-Prasinococcus_capsulatus_cf.AAC.8